MVRLGEHVQSPIQATVIGIWTGRFIFAPPRAYRRTRSARAERHTPERQQHLPTAYRQERYDRGRAGAILPRRFPMQRQGFRCRPAPTTTKASRAATTTRRRRRAGSRPPTGRRVPRLARRARCQVRSRAVALVVAGRRRASAGAAAGDAAAVRRTAVARVRRDVP